MKHCSLKTLSLSIPLLLAAPAAAQSTLVLTGSSSTDDVRLELGPNPGQVQVFGVSNLPSGSAFQGISTIQLDTGEENDTITLLGSLTGSMVFDLLAGAGSDQVFVQFEVPAVPTTDPILAILNVQGGEGSDQVLHTIVNSRNTFGLDVRFDGGTGVDTLGLSMDASAGTVDRLGVWLDVDGGTSADTIDVNVTSAATLALLRASDRPSTEDESVSIAWNQSGAPGVVYTDFALRSGSAKVDLLGQNSFFVLLGSILGGILDDNITVRAEGIVVALGFLIDGGAGQDNIELLCGRNLWGDPVLAGNTGDDALKLIVEGIQYLGLGTPTIDGGPGIDLCDAPGVVAIVVNCEE